jgi:4-hydroxy-tetrahydrodipicolinate synthase
MDHRGEVDEEGLRRYLRWLLPQGIVGLAVNVDTGEGPHLQPEERARVIEVAVEEANGQAAVIAGVMGASTAQSVRGAADAAAAGADAVMVFPTGAFLGEPVDAELIYRYHAAIAEAVDVPQVLFQLQPALSGVIYGGEVIRRLAEIPNVVAIKEASFDARVFVETVRVLERLERKISLLTGNDNFIYESFVLGAEGALIGFGTLVTDLQVEIHRACTDGRFEEARCIWERILPLEEVVFGPPVRNYRARTKEALMMLGVLENSYVRPPLLSISEKEKQKVRVELDKLGLLVRH